MPSLAVACWLLLLVTMFHADLMSPCTQSYGRPSELGQEMRVFVQSVTPGFPAFMSGLFPGDTILEVNGVSVRSDPVAAVVKKITDVPRKNDKKSVIGDNHVASGLQCSSVCVKNTQCVYQYIVRMWSEGVHFLEVLKEFQFYSKLYSNLSPHLCSVRVQLTVMFANGVTRLEKMKKTDNLKVCLSYSSSLS